MVAEKEIKRALELDPNSFQANEAYSVYLTVRREDEANADVVWKRFIHTFINGIDYNRWNSVGGPLIPPCNAQQRNDVTVICSNGNIYFDTTIGRARYKGLLVRAEKRFSKRAQFLASYALGSYVGTNGTGTGTSEASDGRVFGFNNDDWFENYGPLPTVSGVDFNGDGTRDDLLPGTHVNQFNRGLNERDLARLVEQYNQVFAGRSLPNGQPAPRLTLPANFSFNDNYFTQDLRLSRAFPLGGERGRLILYGEVFNLLNTANLVGYGSSLANPAEFGQPGTRFTQVFGSGGPRAFQLGARVSF